MLSFFETPVTVIHLILCLFLGLIILIQPGKSGGLGAAFGGAGGQQVFGGRGAGDLLSRVTWIAAAMFFVTSMLLAYMSSSTTDSLESPAAEEFTPTELPTVEPEPTFKESPTGNLPDGGSEGGGALGAAAPGGTDAAAPTGGGEAAPQEPPSAGGGADAPPTGAAPAQP